MEAVYSVVERRSVLADSKGISLFLCAIALSSLFFCSWPLRVNATSLEFSRKITVEAQRPTENWPLPPAGPPGLVGKTIVYIGEDLRNGGILGVGSGVREAAAAMGWNIKIMDIGSREERRKDVFAEAFSVKPDGIILGGLDGQANAVYLTQFEKAGIPIAGWHVAPLPGPVEGTPIQINIATDSLEVARVAAHYVIADSQGAASVVIFTDDRYAIALKKSTTMAEVIGSCKECTVLETRNLALDTVAQHMPDATGDLLDKYGERWQYSLAVNDLYFDHAVASLVMRGCKADGPPYSISAGDGSPSAFLRIQNDSYQNATIPEPLLFHGWQLIDELNRLMQNQQPSGYITPPHIVSKKNIWSKMERLNLFDPKNNYRKHYLRNWGQESRQ
jgi:ribose transport system substrate-binding protein